ncbi:MAG: hypothetical protein A2X51_12260 [Candidatus Rokubacteria bacterium GWC2_70_24]|nr:MAG: hypothetical protein A2X53_12480 [Candidatus Rokubacteria bacterium GWA2_70_23]OGK90805.1 MAG: hypothetical protein A2X51_12260 [Candidatus Rokubacteria bacterium GWC2_70_24]HAM59239.1 hypothetical protein [Candidatus Rokubacteria bacterium]
MRSRSVGGRARGRLSLILAASLGLVLLGPVWGAGASCPQPTRAILIRHAETQWNALGLLQGHADIPLSAAGRAQAEALAAALGGKQVDAVYASPLSRALETARAIAAPRGLTVTARDDLREIGTGVYTGRPASDIPPATRTTWATNPSVAMPSGVPDPAGLREPAPVQGRWFEGESLSGVAERAWREILSLVGQHCGKDVAIVTHGGVIQLALTRAKGLPATEWRNFRVPNVAQIALEFQPDGAVVVLPGW